MKYKYLAAFTVLIGSGLLGILSKLAALSCNFMIFYQSLLILGLSGALAMVWSWIHFNRQFKKVPWQPLKIEQGCKAEMLAELLVNLAKRSTAHPNSRVWRALYGRAVLMAWWEGVPAKWNPISHLDQVEPIISLGLLA